MSGRGVRVTTGSRLHFGLLGWGPEARRQFGGVGLMVERPGNVVTAAPARGWSAEGLLADRVLATARRVAEAIDPTGGVGPLALRVERAAPEHAGLGTGTQLSLAVARAVAWAAGLDGAEPEQLAAWTGRGRRSGIGLHGFARGGLLVDGGRRGAGRHDIPPLLARLEWPEDWHVLIALPPVEPGLHGPEEARAFDELPPVPAATLDRIGRLVLMELLPAVAERDLVAFGAALNELQQHVGGAFAPAQGGVYADAGLAKVVGAMQAVGFEGFGQSSWGPAVYGVTDGSAEERAEAAKSLESLCGLGPDRLIWTHGRNHGAALDALE